MAEVIRRQSMEREEVTEDTDTAAAGEEDESINITSLPPDVS